MPGARIGDISAAIGAAGRAGGYGICTDFGGHGIGRTMHEDPHIPNEGRPAAAAAGPRAGRRDRAVVPGRRHDSYGIDDDGWTIRSGDGSRAAHVEHTVAITADGAAILTLPDRPNGRWCFTRGYLNHLDLGQPTAFRTSGATCAWRVISGGAPGRIPGPAAAAHAVATSGSRPPCPPWSRWPWSVTTTTVQFSRAWTGGTGPRPAAAPPAGRRPGPRPGRPPPHR